MYYISISYNNITIIITYIFSPLQEKTYAICNFATFARFLFGSVEGNHYLYTHKVLSGLTHVKLMLVGSRCLMAMFSASFTASVSLVCCS